MMLMLQQRERLKAHVTTKKKEEEEPVFNPTPLRCLPGDDAARGLPPLPWEGIVVVQDITNPRLETQCYDDDCGGRVSDFSPAEASRILYLLDPSVTLTVADYMGKSIKPLNPSKRSEDIVVDDSPKGGNVIVQSVGDIMDKTPSIEDLVETVVTGVRDSVDVNVC
ncbi:hypothetical protein LIER_43930 [Lithospermum erythrorhizon]|uniref:Uncharacterized protein n=1 Tax=Lithospermum erythrorhizon TaxID=34254 RepID=A0AAV3REA2_LITER